MSFLNKTSSFSFSLHSFNALYLLSRQLSVSSIKFQSEESVQQADEKDVVKSDWTPKSRRTGLLAIKLGMSQLWDHKGRRRPVTLLQVADNEVVMTRRKEKEGYNGVQIGAFDHPKAYKMSKPVLGQFTKAEVSPKRVLQEFRVSGDALLDVGTKLSAAHFVAGQFVDVCGITIGKGFQGVMKRHGMKGQPASHGVTKTHRKMGATGGGHEPGRIWPGKKMAGRMGGKRATTQNLLVYRINHRFNVLYVRGSVPGHKNSIIRVTDAIRLPHKTPPPFPTFPVEDLPSLPEETYWEYIHPPHAPTIAVSNEKSEEEDSAN